MTELRQRMIRGQNERVEEPGDVKCVAVETDLDSVAGIRRLRELEEENRRLKQMYAESSLDHVMLKDVLTKKL